MNFVGHIAVALGHRDDGPAAAATPRRPPGPAVDDGFLLGAALPDLAAMGRFRLEARSADAEVALGVDLHHRTDEVFHRHPWFREHSTSVSARLEEAGLGRGAARACGHVGVELLLDGHLLSLQPALAPAVDRAFEGAGRLAESLVPLVADAQRPGWRHHLSRLVAWPIPDDYDEPAAVAARLQRILSRRPRLAFAAAQARLVTSVLAEQQPMLTVGAVALLDDVLDELDRGSGWCG